MNKVKAVENYLRANGSITNWEIATKYYTTSPHSIIMRLRKKYGYDAILDEWQKKKVIIDGQTDTVIWKKYIWNLREGENEQN